MSNLKTMEVIAKFIGDKTGVKVHLQPGCHPHADPETKQMWLPTDVVDEHIFPAVALAIHEAGHIKFTDFDPMKIIENEDEFNILNAIEDARINRRLMGLLPNVHGFFRKLYELYSKRASPECEPEILALCNCIMEYDALYEFKNHDPKVLVLESKICGDFQDAVYNLEVGSYERVKKNIKNIIKILGLGVPPAPKPSPKGVGKKEHTKDNPNAGGGEGDEEEQQDGKDDGEKKTEEADDEAEPDGSAGGGGVGSGQGQGKVNQKELPKGNGKIDLSKVEKLTNDNTVLVRNPNADEYVQNTVPAAALTEITKAKFEEMLKIKEHKSFSSESGIVNTNNLSAFFTEDIEELFMETKIMKPKKSKIVIVMDASGSMHDSLLDNNRKYQVVVSAVKAIIESIENVNAAEGLCVDWEINGFEDDIIPYEKETWENQYHPNGGTDISRSFQTARNKLDSEMDVEGNKIIIFLTDGQVGPRDVDQMLENIIKSGSTIRLVIVGVGSDPTDNFATKIIQDRNILIKEDAERVLFDAISVCLED
jgi:hypothetical protein